MNCFKFRGLSCRLLKVLIRKITPLTVLVIVMMNVLWIAMPTNFDQDFQRRMHPGSKKESTDWFMPDEKTYWQYISWTCEEELKTKTRIIDNQHFCDCVPDEIDKYHSLKSRHELNGGPTWKDIEDALAQLKPGGHWTPQDCIPLRRVAIIIPFRDRQAHLNKSLERNVYLWMKQKIELRIFVVEQRLPEIFNKGSLMNAGFQLASKLYEFDCVLFHDVDMMLEDDRNMVTCGHRVIHYGAFIDKFNYQLDYFGIFGGAVSLTPQQFIHINGFSNVYRGWGGEDDDFFSRVNAGEVGWMRPPRSIARFAMITHQRDKTNPRSGIYMKDAKRGSQHLYLSEGLRNTSWTLLETMELPHYTWLHLDIHDYINHTLMQLMYFGKVVMGDNAYHRRQQIRYYKGMWINI